MMVSSVAKKELTHEWENERYKDYQESMQNFQINSKSETQNPRSGKKTSKQEIFLPKTRLSRTGQLLLFTNDENDENEINQTKINSFLAKKSYSKKWLEDVGQELKLEATKLLDERLNENLNSFLNHRKSMGKLIGRNSHVLVQDLNTKSGKDRRLHKASYLEYLPTNFDTKLELDNALKSLNPLENLDKTSTCHSNRTFAEIVDANSSDDDQMNEITRHAFSALSSQPILSADKLISKLSSSARIGNKLSANEKKSENGENSEQVQNNWKSEIVVSYKDTFEPEMSTSAKKASIKSKSSEKDDKNDKSNKKSIEFQKNIINSKKILEKRFKARAKNNSPVIVKATDNAETFSLSSTKTIKPISQKKLAVCNKPTSYSAAKKKIISPKLTNSDKTRENTIDGLAISSAKKSDTDYVTNLNNKNQNSFYCSFVNNRTPNTPLPSHDKNYNSTSITKPSVHFKPIIDDENLEPITISLTEIENELTGNSIKIRRFFDRQSIRINKINIKQEQKPFYSDKFSKSFSAQSSKKKENKLIFNGDNLEPEIENFSIKLIPKINRVKSAPNEDLNQTNILLIPNLELDDELKETENSIEQSKTGKTAEKDENSECLKKIGQDIVVNEIKISKSDTVDSLHNADKSVSDKNYILPDYVDNLSISSRVSSVRKNSPEWFYYENDSGKNESESGTYEKLSKPSKIQTDKKIEETSSSDYQQIMSSRLNSDQEIRNREYSCDETKYYDTDLNSKIEAIAEENNDGLAQLLAHNLNNKPEENHLGQIEESQTSPRENNQKEIKAIEKNEIMVENDKEEELDQIEESQTSPRENNQKEIIAFEKNEIMVENDKEEVFDQIEEKKLDVNDLNSTVEIIISKKNGQSDKIVEQILMPIDKIDLKEEIISNKTSLNDDIVAKNKDDVKEEFSIQNGSIYDGNSEIVLEDSDKNDLEKNDLEKNDLINDFDRQVETTESNDENLLKEIDKTNIMKDENCLLKELIEQNIEVKNDQELGSIKSDLNKDEMTDFQNSKSDLTDESNKNIDTMNSNYRKISISIVIRQPEMTEDSISRFGTNTLSEKSESEKNSPNKEQNDYLEKNKLNQHSIESNHRLVNLGKNDELITSSDEKNKNKLEKGFNESHSKQEIIKKKLDEIETDTKSDTVSEKQTKKVEFSDHIQKQIIASSNDLKNDFKNEKSNVAEFKKPMDLAAELITKANESNDGENISKKLNECVTKPIVSEQTLKEKKTQVESNDKSSKYKVNLSRIDDLLGIKSEDKNQENKDESKKIKKPVKESKFEKKMREKRDRYKNFPYLQLPWDSYEAVIDQDAFKDAFSVPDVLNPLIHQIDPENTSVDELVLERRILEDKILELRQEKLTILSMTNEERAKKNENKKQKKKILDPKIKQDLDCKERIIREERIRLQNESYKRKIERDNVKKIMEEALLEKEKENENLNNELEENQKELNSQLKSILEQISYLEGTEDQIREVLTQARIELRNKIKENHQESKKKLRELHEERRETKLFDFNVKRKELEWLQGMYTDSAEELEKVKAKQDALESDIEQWMFKFENECIEQEKELEDKEVEEDNMFISMENEEEENSLKSVKQEQFELLQEKKVLIENFEEIKNKIIQRIEKVKQEIDIIEGEKIQFELNVQMDVERQKQKLIEIKNAEKEAKEEIKTELEQYKQNLFLTREKNLNLKSDLSFLTHSHNITKPFVFSYVMHWPIELFAKPFDQDKMKKNKPKNK